MTTLGILGWALAVLFARLIWGACKANHGWQRLYKEKVAALRELEHRQLCATMDKDRMEWLSAENTRLTLKCGAICHQIRRLKGRGKSGVNPMHNF